VPQWWALVVNRLLLVFLGFETTPVVSAGVLSFQNFPPTLPPTVTSVGAVADFNGDGRADLALLHVQPASQNVVAIQQYGLATGGTD